MQRTFFKLTSLVLVVTLLLTTIAASVGATPRQDRAVPQQEASVDVGDAPDSSNHYSTNMTAYSSTPAKFPTVYDPATGLPPGPLHWQPHDDAWLGPAVTLEDDADKMPDEDGLTNIDPPADQPDRDGADDGLMFDSLNLLHCQPSTFEVEINIVGGNDERFLNVWFDWNRDGDWDDEFECSDSTIVQEWAVRDQVIGLGNGTHLVTTAPFIAYQPEQPVWMRITLAKQPAVLVPGTNFADGRGPDEGYQFGETEDYFLGGEPDNPPEDPSFSVQNGGPLGFSGADILQLAPVQNDPPQVAIPAANLGLGRQDELDALSYGQDAWDFENGDPGRPCVMFEGLPLGNQYHVGDTFTDSGVDITAVGFEWSTGEFFTGGLAIVENGGLAGGAGQEMHLNNVNLAFNFGGPIPGLDLLFGEYGGNLNLEINGDFRNFENLADIDGLVIGGVQVSVVGGLGNDMGSLTLSGDINSFSIGGQEFWIDDICPWGQEEPDPLEYVESINFSLRPGAIGITNTAVWVEANCQPAQVAGDEYGVDLPGQNSQVFDEDGLPCSASNDGYPLGLTLEDDLDALNRTPPQSVDEDGDGIPDKPVYFSLQTGSPSLVALGATPADILMTLGGALPVIFAPGSDLGLQDGDELDALALLENENGFFDPATSVYTNGDKLAFSLAAGSPTLAALGRNPGDLLAPNTSPAGGPPVLAFPAGLIGLLKRDDLNALKTNIPYLWELIPFPDDDQPDPEPSACVVYPIGGPEGWAANTTLPVKREGGFATIIGNFIYVGQGVSNLFGGDDTHHFVYHIPSGTWSWRAPALIRRAEMTSICAPENGQGKVFVVGGRDGSTGNILDDLQVYNPVANAWSVRPSMPTPRAGLGAAWVPFLNTIYVFGGRDGSIPHDGSPLDVVEAYDVAAGSWATMAPMPTPMMDIYSTVYYSSTHSIYVIGGYDGTSVTSMVQIYDVVNDSWSAGAPMPTPRSNALAGICKGKIYAIGGYDGVNEYDVNEAYDPLGDSWSVGHSPLPWPRSEFMTQGVFTGKDIYAIGEGIHGDPGTAHDVYTCGEMIEELADLGDAPDSTNHTSSAMTAYPPSVMANYPSVYQGAPPYGPIHWQPRADAWLGMTVTLENDADLMPDEDGLTNIEPPADLANRDGADDGLIFDSLNLVHCQPSTLDVQVNIVGGNDERFLNIWFDWNRDGDWDDEFECQDATIVQEWAVRDQVMGLGNGTHIVTSMPFNAYQPEQPTWMRITLAKQPTPPAADGRGPDVGYQFGETEDYFLLGNEPPTDWFKTVNGEPWHPEMLVTAQTSDTIRVVDAFTTREAINLVESWDPGKLKLVDWAFDPPGVGQWYTDTGMLVWQIPAGEPQGMTLTKWFHVEPCTWTETILMEELWVGDVQVEQRPVQIHKIPPALWLDSEYQPEVEAGQLATFTLLYGNDGGFENWVWIRNQFPPEAPFVGSEPPPDNVDPAGLWAVWDIGGLPMGQTGQIEVIVAIDQSLPPSTTLEIWDWIYDHAQQEWDTAVTTFHVASCSLPTADFDWSPRIVRTGSTVIFTGTATGAPPITFGWDFGDGQSAVGAVVTHTYALAEPGAYSVTLTATNACGSDTVIYTLFAYLRFDFDLDCDVDIVDIMAVASRWQCAAGDPCYDPLYDIDSDGDVDIVDIMQTAAWWGWTCN